MSTFNGEIEEIKGISVDEFKDLSQKAYFLSHFHSDHIRGLRSLKTDAPIYATEITALFIRRKCPELSKNIRILVTGLPTAVEISREDSPVNFVVTALSAGHCAGSCILLFQIEGCDILYTGDFRISLNNERKMKILNEIKSHQNTVIYLDSTFLKTSFENFPSQTESVQKILEIIEKFLKTSRTHKINLIVPARYGYEYLLMEIYAKLKEKIFINEAEVYEQYLTISFIHKCVTNNARNARIFLTPTYVKNPHQIDDVEDVLNLQLSAMFWTNWKTKTPFILKTDKNSFRICYATHNSLSEIRDFLNFLKPKKVYLNVVPEAKKEKEEMYKQLEIIQRDYLEKDDEEVKIPPKKFSFKRLRSDLPQVKKQ